MPPKDKLIINLFNDWIEILKKELLSFGYILNPNETPDNICDIYFNLVKRLIQPIPREILIASEFNCPPELKEGLDKLKEKISQGVNLKPHLSTKLMDPNYNDSLLNDWGIHHLHLGTTLDDCGFIIRTGPVLFARFDDKYAYLVNVSVHGSWSKQEFINALHRNWPASIEIYRLRGVTGLAFHLSDEDIGKLRKANIITMVEAEPGVVYSPIGGGYASSGISSEVVRKCIRYKKHFNKAETYIRENLSQISKSAGINLGPEIEFHLETKEGGNLYAVDRYSKLAIKI